MRCVNLLRFDSAGPSFPAFRDATVGYLPTSIGLVKSVRIIRFSVTFGMTVAIGMFRKIVIIVRIVTASFRF